MADQKYWMKSTHFDWGYVSLAEAIQKVSYFANNEWTKAKGDIVTVSSKDGENEYELECLNPAEGVQVKQRK